MALRKKSYIELHSAATSSEFINGGNLIRSTAGFNNPQTKHLLLMPNSVSLIYLQNIKGIY
jgi:hypothetical protein